MTIKRYIYTFIVLTIVLALSLFPVPEMPQLEGVPFIDKWTHMVMYAGLEGAICIDILRNRKSITSRLCILLTLSAAMLGGIIELIQPLVGRSCELADFIADIIGTILCYIIILIIKKITWA